MFLRKWHLLILGFLNRLSCCLILSYFVPRARFSFGQHQEHGPLPIPKQEVRQSRTSGSSTQTHKLGTTVIALPIHHLHKSHNTPLLPPKICIGIVFDFSRDIFMSQEKLQTMLCKGFGR